VDTGPLALRVNDEGGPMARFLPGKIVITRGALAALSVEAVQTALRRHLAGDWGAVDAHDAAENDLSLQQGFRLLSAYSDGNTRFWIITEADRSATTILLPSEY
jgi:hypothetical protein